MQSCEKCRIQIRGNKRCCPLCGGSLSGEADAEQAGFPSLPRKKVSKFTLVKTAAFGMIVLELVMGTVCYLGHSVFPWAVFVMIFAPLAWLDIAIAFYTRNNIMYLVSIQTYVGMGLAMLIDYLTGHPGWAAAWMFPFCFPGLAAAIIAIGKGLKMILRDYILFLGMDFILSLAVQMLLIRIGWNPAPMAAVISMLIMGIMAIAAVFFWFKEVRNAAEKLFHM